MDDVLCALMKKLNIPIPDIGTQPSKTEQSSCAVNETRPSKTEQSSNAVNETRPSKTEQSSNAVNETRPSKTEQSSNAVNETRSSKTAGQTKIQLSNAGTEADTQCTPIDSHITQCT